MQSFRHVHTLRRPVALTTRSNPGLNPIRATHFSNIVCSLSLLSTPGDASPASSNPPRNAGEYEILLLTPLRDEYGVTGASLKDDPDASLDTSPLDAEAEKPSKFPSGRGDGIKDSRFSRAGVTSSVIGVDRILAGGASLWPSCSRVREEGKFTMEDVARGRWWSLILARGLDRGRCEGSVGVLSGDLGECGCVERGDVRGVAFVANGRRVGVVTRVGDGGASKDEEEDEEEEEDDTDMTRLVCLLVEVARGV